jgi:hypothetical protein
MRDKGPRREEEEHIGAVSRREKGPMKAVVFHGVGDI